MKRAVCCRLAVQYLRRAEYARLCTRSLSDYVEHERTATARTASAPSSRWCYFLSLPESRAYTARASTRVNISVAISSSGGSTSQKQTQGNSPPHDAPRCIALQNNGSFWYKHTKRKMQKPSSQNVTFIIHERFNLSYIYRFTRLAFVFISCSIAHSNGCWHSLVLYQQEGNV